MLATCPHFVNVNHYINAYESSEMNKAVLPHALLSLELKARDESVVLT